MQPVGMSLGEFLVSLQILYCVHALQIMRRYFRSQLLHVGGIFAHRLRYVFPLRLLGRRDLQRGVKVRDPPFDDRVGPLRSGRRQLGRRSAIGAGPGHRAGEERGA